MEMGVQRGRLGKKGWQSFAAVMFAAAMMSVISGGANAGLSYKLFTENKNQADVKDYVRGVGEGIVWMHAYHKTKGGTASSGGDVYFCPPERMVLNTENYFDLIERGAAEVSVGTRASMPVEMLLIFGLVKTFPCPASAK